MSCFGESVSVRVIFRQLQLSVTSLKVKSAICLSQRTCDLIPTSGSTEWPTYNHFFSLTPRTRYVHTSPTPVPLPIEGGEESGRCMYEMRYCLKLFYHWYSIHYVSYSALLAMSSLQTAQQNVYLVVLHKCWNTYILTKTRWQCPHPSVRTEIRWGFCGRINWTSLS